MLSCMFLKPQKLTSIFHIVQLCVNAREWPGWIFQDLFCFDYWWCGGKKKTENRICCRVVDCDLSSTASFPVRVAWPHLSHWGPHGCSSGFPPFLLSNCDVLFVGTFLCHTPGFAVNLSFLLYIVSYFSFAIDPRGSLFLPKILGLSNAFKKKERKKGPCS